MEERDLPFVMKIEQLSFPHPWLESSFKGEIDNRHISFPSVIIHRPHERIIGYIIFWYLSEEAQISNFAVHPDFRGLGVGRNILRTVLELLESMNVRSVFLEVRPSNLSARRLYSAEGFTLMGIRRNYYQNPLEDALVMTKKYF